MLRDSGRSSCAATWSNLAVAVVLGTAFTAVVNAAVRDLVTPLIAAVGGKPDFGELAFTINGSRFADGSQASRCAFCTSDVMAS